MPNDETTVNGQAKCELKGVGFRGPWVLEWIGDQRASGTRTRAGYEKIETRNGKSELRGESAF